MKKTLITLSLLISLMSTSVCSAGALQSIQDNIGTDKIAHFGVGYIVADQLKRHTKMSALERALVVGGLAVAKECTDSEFETKDVVATVLGAIGLNISGKF